MSNKQKPYIKQGDKVDRYLQHKISSDWKVTLNRKMIEESTKEIKKYNKNKGHNYADEQV